MKIAVSTSLFTKTYFNDDDFIIECLIRIAEKNPTDNFIFISDNADSKSYSFPKNIKTHIIAPEIKSLLLWRLWYNYKLPAFLKKNKVDVLVNADGFCSLRTKTPQCIIAKDLSVTLHPEFFIKSFHSFYKKFTQPSLQKAKKIVTISMASKKEIIDAYKIDEPKINIIPACVNEIYKPISFKEKESVKEKYTEGKEFFLYNGPLHEINNLINLLKAFSFFKKRQNSNMQLVIAVTGTSNNEKFIESLKTYKYRSEVKLIEAVPKEELIKIIAAAYVFIQVPFFNDSATALLQAMKCNIPVIASDIPVFREMLADTALYVNPDNHEDIADKMMLLFKDEKKRNELIEEGKLQSENYHLDKTADTLWQSILETAQL